MNTLRRCQPAIAWAGMAILHSFGALAAGSARPPEVSIPFVSHGGIQDWAADKDRGLWVQDVHRRWYYAEFMSPCTGLDFAMRVAFDTRPLDSLDRFSSIIVPGEGRCRIKGLAPSEGPPKKAHVAARGS